MLALEQKVNYAYLAQAVDVPPASLALERPEMTLTLTGPLQDENRWRSQRRELSMQSQRLDAL
jgi:hypothetical protein